MAKPESSREEALRRLDERADALAKSTARPASASAAHGSAVGKAYQIIAELVGGAVVGLALGAGADWLLGTAPWGLIVGVLFGFAVAVYMAKRTADSLMAQAAREQATAGAAAERKQER